MKKYASLIYVSIVSILAVSSFQSFPQDLNDSLLIHYKWDNDSIDYSGNNYDPVSFNVAYAPDRFGTENAAAYFNGTDHFIGLPDTMTLKPEFPLTIAFWAKMEQATLDNGIFFTNDFSETGHCGAFINYSNNQSLSISYADGSSFGPDARRTKHSDQYIVAGEWYFIAAVFHTSQDMRIFIDGAEDMGFLEGLADEMVYSGEGGTIGLKDFANNMDPFYYNGYMDEFRYWNRGLSNLEVLKLYEDGLVFINDQRSDQEIIIYPNPVVNNINLSPPPIATAKYNIRNSVGQIILKGNCSKNVGVQELEPGAYILEIELPDRIYPVIKKFIKQ